MARVFNELAKLIFLECWYQDYMAQRCPVRTAVSRSRFFNQHVILKRRV